MIAESSLALIFPYSVGEAAIPAALRMVQELGKDTGVVADNAVGQQPQTLAPQLLLLIGSDPQLARIGVCHGTYRFMVGLAAVQRPLHIAAEAQGRLMKSKRAECNRRILLDCAPCRHAQRHDTHNKNK